MAPHATNQEKEIAPRVMVLLQLRNMIVDYQYCKHAGARRQNPRQLRPDAGENMEEGVGIQCQAKMQSISGNLRVIRTTRIHPRPIELARWKIFFGKIPVVAEPVRNQQGDLSHQDCNA